MSFPAATTSRRTRLEPAKRRQQLLQCALSAFAEHGVARATHSHVAERAGVSVPTVHAYFRTRDDLVIAVISEVEAFLRTITTEELAPRRPVDEALMGLARRFAHDAKENPDMTKIWLDWTTGVGGDYWPRYLDVLDGLQETAKPLFRRAKREGVLAPEFDVTAAARITMGCGYTIALSQFACVSDKELDAMMRQIVRGILCVGYDRELVI